MIEWLMRPWYAWMRHCDLVVLWPACTEHALDLDQAKAAFAYHAFNDRAWLVLGKDEIVRRIDALKRERR